MTNDNYYTHVLNDRLFTYILLQTYSNPKIAIEEIPELKFLNGINYVLYTDSTQKGLYDDLQHTSSTTTNRYGYTNFKSNQYQIDPTTSIDLKYIVQFAPEIFLELCSISMSDDIYKLITETKDDSSIENIQSFCSNPFLLDMACQNQTKNKRCACQSDFIHPQEAYNVANVMKNYDTLVNTDPWCLYSDCASGDAIKKNQSQRRSVCANISMAGIFTTQADNSTINITNTQVTATSQNDVGINILGSCANCNGNCKYNKDTSKLECDTINSANIKQKNVNVSNPTLIIVYCIILLLCIISIFFIYKKVQNTVSKSFLLLLIICIIVYIITKITTFKEPFNELCYKNSTCSTNSDTECLYNKCQCKIGYTINDKNICTLIQDNEIVLNLPFLPEIKSTGTYFYSTTINNIIYACADQCTFYFDGQDWSELDCDFNALSGLSIGNTNYGFDPYVDYTNTSTNQNCGCSYNNKLYRTYNYTGSDSSGNSIIIMFDPMKNKWEPIFSIKKSFIINIIFLNNELYFITKGTENLFRNINNKPSLPFSKLSLYSYTSTDTIVYICDDGIYTVNPITDTIINKVYTFDTNKPVGLITYKNQVVLFTSSKIFFIIDITVQPILSQLVQTYTSPFPFSPALNTFTYNNIIFMITPTGEIFTFIINDTDIYVNSCYPIAKYKLPLKYKNL